MSVATTLPSTGAPTNSALPFTMKQFYIKSKKWRSWDVVQASASTPQKLMEDALLYLEKTFGRAILARFSRLLHCFREGISESELEDLLSIDADVLSDSVNWQLNSSSPLALSSPLVIPRVPCVVISSLLTELIQHFQMVKMTRGIGRSVHLLKWANRASRDAADRIYCNDSKVLQATYADIAGYFGNNWVTKNYESTSEGDGKFISISSKLFGASGDQWKGVLKPHSLLVYNPLEIISFSGSTRSFNPRVVRELFPALLRAQKWRELVKHIHDYPFLEAFVSHHVRILRIFFNFF
jgi:hypothetical protein